jgi:hypothetical protein
MRALRMSCDRQPDLMYNLLMRNAFVTAERSREGMAKGFLNAAGA